MRFIEQQQTKQLQELGAVALRRAKNAADYGAATLDRLNLRGPISCNPSELQAGRLLVYQRSGVKDIRLLSREGQVMCSAYPETLEFDKRWAGRDEMLAARDDTIRDFRDQRQSLRLPTVHPSICCDCPMQTRRNANTSTSSTT